MVELHNAAAQEKTDLYKTSFHEHFLDMSSDVTYIETSHFMQKVIDAKKH